MKVLIIEDEPYAQNELKRLLNNSEFDILILDCFDSVEDSVQWLKLNNPPDLIFMDIQLSDGLSFEIFKQTRVITPVIFTTAYDEYAIKAFKVNSVDYLLKPIKQVELNDALDKFKSLGQQFSKVNPILDLEQIQQLLSIQKPAYKTRFIAKVGDQIKYTDIKEVAYFRAEDNEVMLITSNNNKYVIEYSLDHLVNVLDPYEFFRANRSYIVTVNSINKISKYFNSRLHLELVPQTEDTVLISRVKVPEFLKWIDK
ncbi:MAG: LytTR family DNA-binding domain-containing protein [Bacteroidales bacterium]|nr:LytTR family DNA-binding domain-containing protein [Bacteroidales bacterium]